MSRQQIDIGVEGNDGTGDSIRESFRKVNENFQEIYAIFGAGGTIDFTDLDDTPDSYEGLANRFAVVKADGSGIDLIPILSQGAITGDPADNTITATVQNGQLILQAVNTKVSDDPSPVLSGPLSGAGQFGIGRISVTDNAAQQFNNVHSSNITINDLVIDKKFADQNYLGKSAPGLGARIADEPDSSSVHILTLDTPTAFSAGNAVITDHGLDPGVNGAPYVFQSTGDDPSNLVSGQIYYIRYIDDNQISLHTTQSGAQSTPPANQVSPLGGTGALTLTDAAYDDSLLGNWADNQVLPRKSIVRRQGDTMEGALFLNDHPGDLAGVTAPDGDAGLQAATKFYVDSQSYQSVTNLYVNEQGDDSQTGVPRGQEGRSESYAYRTIGAACAKAEELQLASPFEPGPYVQTITYDAGNSNTRVVSGGFSNPVSGSDRAVVLLQANKDFIAKEVIAFIDANYPNFEYNEAEVENDINRIIDSINLDIQAGTNANYLSRWAGFYYYRNPQETAKIGEQYDQTRAGIIRARQVALDVVRNIAVTPLQTEVTQFSNLEPATAQVTSSVEGKFTVILDVLENGPLGAPNVVDGSTYVLNIDNGGFGFVDQGNPNNTDIIAGKIVRGKTSGAVGRIVSYTFEADEDTETNLQQDKIEIQLLEPIEFVDDTGLPEAPGFIAGEELEYGNLVRRGQISVRVESGIYLEDYPIRVPDNVSIKGDEFRRVIVRPANRISQSRWARTYFYRDIAFDGMTANANTSVTGFAERGLARDGFPFVNPQTGNIDGYFGYHYLEDPEDVNSTPRHNFEMDVFMMNDATILRNLTVQGHGGFMVVLDPDGQVLTKSPYIQTGSSFSASVNRQSFRGGMYIDGFTGNTPVRVYDKDDPFTLLIRSEGSQNEPQGLFVRRPQTPAPFYVDGIRYQVNSIAEYDQDTGTAKLLLDRTSNSGQGFTLTVGNSDFSYNEFQWREDFRNIIRGVAFDTAFSTNYNAVTNGLVYQRSYRNDEILERKSELIDAINQLRTETKNLDNFDPAVDTRIENSFNEIVNIIENGIVSTNASASTILFPSPTGVSVAKESARDRLQNNKLFLQEEATAFIAENFSTLDYNEIKCKRDIEYIVDALTYDILYGGNSASVDAAIAYYFGTVGYLGFGQELATADTYDHLASVISDIVQGNPVTPTTGNDESVDTSGSNTTLEIANELVELFSIIEDVIRGNDPALVPVKNYPNTENEPAIYSNAKSVIFLGSADIIDTVIDVVNADLPYPIVLQTAGNRSMLGNDFTQVNDLGYGLVVNNSGLSEMVSMFTYYCWTAYYSGNGSQIRSLNGSNANGEYGLVADGADPNEIPDDITLLEDMTQSAKAFEAAAIIIIPSTLTVTAGDTITQTATPPGSESTVVFSTTGRKLYVKDVNGILNTSDELIINGTPSGVTPENLEILNYTNDFDGLQLFAYDLEYSPNTRSELDVLHPVLGQLGRYEVSNVELVGIELGAFEGIDSYSYTTDSVAGDFAEFTVRTSLNVGYDVEIINDGAQFEVGDTITIPGNVLGGATPGNDLTITIDAVSILDGSIDEISTSGTVNETETTPVRDGKVYRFNFSTGNQETENGLLEDISANQFINFRGNQTFVLDNIQAPDILVIRPSTAVIFDAAPEIVYRSISFSTTDSIGNPLEEDQSLSGFDSTFDYVRMIVDPFRANESTFAPLGQTQGASAGDTVIAINLLTDEDDRFRINNNLLTDPQFRPDGFTEVTAVDPHIFVWQGRKFKVFNYREIDGLGQIAEPAESNSYALVNLQTVQDDDITGSAGTGLGSPVVLGGAAITLRAGLPAGSAGNITVNISTCRATGHDFLDIGTGGFNTSNYPNVIFGNPREKQQPNEVDERGKGRVFWVSTDQDGFFRVGPFFTVDQGTGTVTFAASIALSNVDGIGFKRGVVVSEFSTDTAMTDNAADSVPVESAIRGYVNRRLGFDHAGLPVSNKIGPGVLVSNGAVALTADINAAGNTLTNVRDPIAGSDAANKSYVDNQVRQKAKVTDLRDFLIAEEDADQLFAFTGIKKLFVDAGSIVGGTFNIGDEIVGEISGATGNIVDVETTVDVIDGNVVIVYYEATSVTEIQGNERIDVVAGANGQIIDGPISEIANGINASDTDIVIETTRNITTDPVSGDVTDRNVELALKIKSDTIVNADVNSNAGIQQSKLSLNSAQATRTNATGITQNDLGVAHFDAEVFSSTDGFVTINDGQLPLEKIQRINDGTVLGNIAGDSSTDHIQQIPLSELIVAGAGLVDADFLETIAAIDDPGEALIKIGEGDYKISNVTTTGEPNSLVKTQSDGSIRVNSLRLGGDNTYEILSLDTTEVFFKTPGQGLILSAVGGSPGGGGSDPTYPDVQIPGNLDIGGVGTGESSLKAASNFAGESVLASDWIYSSFIEAPGEKGAASTGIAIGANTGKSTAGQIAIVTADSGTSSSVSPAIFSSTGFLPDLDDVYNIGSAALKYNTIYATVFEGTATQAFYADLAENYVADELYEFGTVVVFGGSEEITVTDKKGDTRVAGVVSHKPAHLMNTQLEGDTVVPLALQGRVPVKVIGSVQKGDILVTSAIPGFAIVDNNPGVGTVIGKAVGEKPDGDRGWVEVVVGRV